MIVRKGAQENTANTCGTGWDYIPVLHSLYKGVCSSQWRGTRGKCSRDSEGPGAITGTNAHDTSNRHKESIATRIKLAIIRREKKHHRKDLQGELDSTVKGEEIWIALWMLPNHLLDAKSRWGGSGESTKSENKNYHLTTLQKHTANYNFLGQDEPLSKFFKLQNTVNWRLSLSQMYLPH